MDFTVDEKFAKVVVDLRRVRPFYSAVYEAMPKQESEIVDTMGVNSTHLTFNRKFVEKISYGEFLFTILHEIAHVALIHVSRRGDRNPQIWNIACDLYVNKLLCDEFSVYPGGISNELKMEVPKGIMYTNTLNTDTEIVEEIYIELMKQFDQQGNEGGVKHLRYKGSLAGTEWEAFMIPNDMPKDLIDDGKDKNQQDSNCKRILVDAKTRYEMSSSGSKSYSDEKGKLKFLVDAILESKIDWKKLLRKYCILYKSTEVSFKNPDKRMYYQSAIYPGAGDESTEVLRNVKVCVDTSGSMSDEDLSYILGQIRQLMMQYDTTAEMICWDAGVESTTILDSNSNFGEKQKSLAGRGGTDPTCLFEYFDSKACKVKPFVVLIFTDGYFEQPALTPIQRRKYKNTIWVMTRDYNKDLNPTIGKLAFAEFDKQ